MRTWLVLAALIALALPATATAQTGPQPLRIDVRVGPGGSQACTIDADLYVPAGASAAARVPAVMATNGFGNAKDEFDAIGPAFAARGYAFLAYSGLGFGDSTCKITLDDREHDGAAGSQLLSFLAGTTAATDGTKVDFVALDGPGDPRVGMLGGSYGGQIQFAVAGVDPRLDTIVPQITWNDLSYALAPNNTGLTGVTYAEPGAVKLDWPLLFFGVGTGQGLAAALTDPSKVGTCPNFADGVCPALLSGAATGYLPPSGVALLRNASVSSYYDSIRIPTFLIQGQSDNLFNLQESVATYDALRARGVPVKLLWRSAGHSGGGLGDSESNWAAPEAAYESRMILQWFDHYLKGAPTAPALDFGFLTDWLPYAGDAAPAVGVTPAYPAGADQRLALSGTDGLVAGEATAGRASMVAVPGAPSSLGGGLASPEGADAPGTSIAYTTAPLDQPLDVVGIPKLRLRLDAPTFAGAPDPAARLTLFAKLYDVAPDGSATIPRNQVSAVRVADPTQPLELELELPGLAHRFDAGHRLRLTVSTSSATYRSSAAGGPVAIVTDPADPSVLTLPRLGAQAGPTGSGPNGTTPFAAPGAAGAAPAPVAVRKPGKGQRKRPVRPAARLRRARCGRRGRRIVRLRLLGAKRLKVARITVNGRRARTLRGKRLRRKVAVRLPRGRARVVVKARTRGGARRRSARTYRGCRRTGRA